MRVVRQRSMRRWRWCRCHEDGVAPTRKFVALQNRVQENWNGIWMELAQSPTKLLCAL